MKIEKKHIKVIVSAAATAAVIALIVIFLPSLLNILGYVISLLMPFIVGYIFSLAAIPLTNWLQKKIKLPRGVCAVIVIVLFLGIIGGVCGFLVWKVVDEARGIYVQFPSVIEKIRNAADAVGDKFSGLYQNLPLSTQQSLSSIGDTAFDRLAEIANTQLVPLVNNAGNFAKAIPGILVAVIVFILSSYFMIKDNNSMRRVINKCISPAFSERLGVVKTELGKYLGGYLKAQGILLLIAFVIIFAGLWILGVEYALLIAFIIAFIDALPFFGSGFVLWPWAIIAFIGGDIKTGIGMLLIYLAVQVMRRFTEPKLVSAGMGLNPILTLMSMYIGYKVWSLGGLIVGPIVLMILVSFYKAGMFDSVIRFVKDLWRLIKKQLKRFKNFVFSAMENDWDE